MLADPSDRLDASALPTVAVVLAGGTGSRLGLDIPKQLVKIAGKTVLEHTVAILDAAPDVDEILVMMAAGYEREAEDLLLTGRFPKISAVLPGGSTRAETTQIALDAIGHNECKVLFHDAVRPLLSHRIVRECVNALRLHAAVDVAIPSPDTIIAVDDDNTISAIPPRASLRLGQTPQGFHLSTIRRAYELAGDDPDFVATDDCGVVHRYLPDVPIKVIEGSSDNMKITHPVDVFIVDKLFQLATQSAPAPRSDHEYADELRGRTMVVFGGGSGIGADLVALAASFGADVFSFSRTQTGTHVEDPEHVRPRWPRRTQQTGRIDYVVVTAGDPAHRATGRRSTGERGRGDRGELPGTGQHRPGQRRLPGPDQGPVAALHVQLVHPRSGQLCAVFGLQGRRRQPGPGAGRRVVADGCPGELHESRAHRDTDANSGVRRRADVLAAVFRGRRAGIARRAGVQPHRSRLRHPASGSRTRRRRPRITNHLRYHPLM